VKNTSIRHTSNKKVVKRKPLFLPKAFTVNLKGASPFAAIVAVGFAISSVFAFAKQLDAELNSPEMIQSRKNVEIQKIKDKNARDADQALKTGDLTEVDKDLS